MTSALRQKKVKKQLIEFMATRLFFIGKSQPIGVYSIILGHATCMA